MQKTIIGVIIAAIVIGLGVWFLTQNNKSTSGEVTMVKVGLLMPLTGPRADAGEFSKNALMLAQEKINNNTKTRYKVTFLQEDSRYEPTVAVSAIRKLIDIDKVQFVIGPHGSSEVLAVTPIMEEAKKILIVPAAQSDEISKAGDYIFRLIHNTAQEAPAFATFVARNMESDTLHFLAVNTAITDSYLKYFRPTFEKEGKKIGLVEKVDPKAVDFKTELLKIKSQQAKDIYLLSTPKQVGIALKQAHDLGIVARYYSLGVEGPDTVKNAGEFADGLLYPYSYDVNSAQDSVQEFSAAYRTRFGGDPDTIAANTYDAALLLSRCFESVGVNVEDVKNCLYQTKDFDGAGGTFSIDQNGDAVKPLIIKTIKNGAYIKAQDLTI